MFGRGASFVMVVALASSAACPGERALDGLACDASGACLEGFLCLDGRCVAQGECGNGSLEIGEECDGADLGSRQCPFGAPGQPRCTDECTVDWSDCAVRCGDGQRHDSEVCDDGNRVADDLCSPGCDEMMVPSLETEPNDDGSPSADDDFLAAAATGPVLTDALFAGVVDGGDQDVWRVSVEGPTRLTVSLHGRDAVGRCGISANVRLREASGAVLFELSRASPSGCPRGAFDLDAGRTVFVEVFDNEGGDAYLLGLDFSS